MNHLPLPTFLKPPNVTARGAPRHTQQAPVRRSVPLLGGRFLIGRRRRLRRFLQVGDIGKVILLGHTDGQSQDHHLPFAETNIRTKIRDGKRNGEDGSERTVGHGGGRGAEGTGGGTGDGGGGRGHFRF